MPALNFMQRFADDVESGPDCQPTDIDAAIDKAMNRISAKWSPRKSKESLREILQDLVNTIRGGEK